MTNHTAKSPGSKPAKATLGVLASTAGSKPESAAGSSPAPMTAEARRAMIAEAAYYIAEQRGFECGRDVEDWLLAEKQIDMALAA